MRPSLWIGFFISAICLYFAFRGIPFSAMVEAIRAAQWGWVVLAVAVYFGGYVMRALRWKVLLKPVVEVSAKKLFPPLFIGFFANNVLPFRMGEIIRAYVVGRKLGVSGTASFGTVLLERLFDAISFLLIFSAVTFVLPFPPAVQKGAAVMGATAIATCLAIVLGVRYQAFVIRKLQSSHLDTKIKTRILSVVDNLSQGVSGLLQVSSVLTALAMSLMVWTIEATMFYLIGRAFEVHPTYPQTFFLLFFLGLSVALPQAPGFVGTIEFFGTMALTLVGIPRERGLPIVLTIHATQFVFIMAAGTWALWNEGLSLRDIASQKAGPTPS